MRNWVIVGIGFALLAGNGWAKPSAVYRTVEQICLFSPTLSPAESPVGIQILGLGRPYSIAYGYRDNFQMRSARQVSNWSTLGGITKSRVIAAVTPLKGMEELSGDWGLAIKDLNPDIFGMIENDWTSYGLRGSVANVDYSKPTFVFSGVPAAGIERNGFVAGFKFKY